MAERSKAAVLKNVSPRRRFPSDFKSLAAVLAQPDSRNVATSCDRMGQRETELRTADWADLMSSSSAKQRLRFAGSRGINVAHLSREHGLLVQRLPAQVQT